MINVNSNFHLGSKDFLDSRQSVTTLDDLLALDTNIIPNGFECYVEALDCKYKYHEDYNETDTGHWKKVSDNNNSTSSSTYIINCTIVSETGLEIEVANYDGDFTKIKQTIADGGKVELRTNFNSSNYILEPSRIEENYVTFNTIDKNANITIKVTEYGINDVSYIDLNSGGSTVIRETLSKILLYAHRGFTQFAPDCSRPAWEDAKRFGFYGLEVDIYSTADNVFICWHDNTIDDLTNGTGKPTELTWDYLQTVEYDSGNGIKNYPHLKIERIESLFSWVKINNMPTLLDVKTIHSYTELTQMVVDWGLEDLIIICTQSEQALNEIRAVSNFVRMRFWEDGINDIYHTIDIASKYYRCDVSNAITEITKEMVEYAHNKGIRIGCYSYNTEIESPFEYYRIANLGVDTATINGIFNANDFSNCEIKHYSIDEFAKNLYAHHVYEKKDTISEVENSTSGCKYYDDGELLVISKIPNYSGSICQMVKANKGDIIEVITRCKLPDVGLQSEEEVFHHNIYRLKATSYTEPLSISVVGQFSAQESKVTTNSTGFDNIEDWIELKSYFLCPNSEGYIVECGISATNINKLLYLNKFDVNVIQTGTPNDYNDNKVLLKDFTSSSERITDVTLHRTSSSFKELLIELDWDGMEYEMSIPTTSKKIMKSFIWVSEGVRFYVARVIADYKNSAEVDGSSSYNKLTIDNSMIFIDENNDDVDLASQKSSALGIKKIWGIR